MTGCGRILRDHLERQVRGMLDEAKSIQARAWVRCSDVCASRPTTQSWASSAPEQRKLFDETQRVMSLLEGFSDWVMDEVGAELCRTWKRSRAFRRAAQPTAAGTVDRLIGD
jgi:hypothetical protein